MSVRPIAVSPVLPTSLSPVSAVVIAPAPQEAPPTTNQSSVTFILDGSPRRVRWLQQLLWMRLEGLSISAIARALHCDTQTVQSVIDLWQDQTAKAEHPLALQSIPFEPLAVCPRREAGRKRKTTLRSRPLARSRGRSEKIFA